RWNHPAWWLDRLAADWPDRWQAIATADNERPPMTLRVNARRATVAGYLAELESAGLAGEAVGAWAVRLQRPVPVGRLPGFERGAVSVQDANAQRPVELLLAAPLPPGARVLDACAAPGGKTAQLLEQADVEVLAIDRDPARLARVDEALARLGLAARTVAADAGAPEAWWDG